MAFGKSENVFRKILKNALNEIIYFVHIQRRLFTNFAQALVYNIIIKETEAQNGSDRIRGSVFYDKFQHGFFMLFPYRENTFGKI